MNQLEWKDFVRVGMLIFALGTMWWQLDSKVAREIHALDARLTSRIDALDTKIERLDDKIDRKIDRLHSLLTNHLIALNRENGKLRTAHTHEESD